MTGDSDDDTIVEDETVTDAAKHRQSERADHITAMIGDEAAGLLEDRTYPTTSEELAQEYATHPVELPNETESLGSVFDRLNTEEYTSPEEAQQTLTRLFPAVDILVIPFRDAQTVLNYERDPRQLAHHLAAEYDLETVIVTNGERGSLAWHDNTVYEQEIYDADTHDAIGTGDAFVGAFLARRLAGDGVTRAMKYAAATASLKRTIAGDIATVTKSEVESVIGDDMEEISR
jgi:2-dehydro-3-deoxygluconokinase